jgi:hypothetical protein
MSKVRKVLNTGMGTAYISAFQFMQRYGVLFETDAL